MHRNLPRYIGNVGGCDVEVFFIVDLVNDVSYIKPAFYKVSVLRSVYANPGS